MAGSCVCALVFIFNVSITERCTKKDNPACVVGGVYVFIGYQHSSESCAHMWRKFGLWFGCDPGMNLLTFGYDPDLDQFSKLDLTQKLKAQRANVEI